jgi:ribonuclease J
MNRDHGNGPLRLIPLGGLGEFGLNSLVVSFGDHHLLLDAGLLFPSAEMPGVDSIVPDFQFLAERKEGLLGILLTHGHEDHIGALAFALEQANAPVFGSRLTLGFVRKRLADRGVSADLRMLVPNVPVELGPFRIHPIRVAHSVLDSLALAIETPTGTVIASGDFKMDPEAPPEERTDAAALAAFGDRGVLALLSDSTGVEQRGRTPGEDSLRPAFEDVLLKTEGRVLVSCFATSIPRIQRVARWGLEHGRRVGFVGRRMADNAQVALELGLLQLPEGALFDPSEEVPPEETLLFVSGSQGEPLSALSAISVGEHREVSVAPGDTVVLSARAIPGNERTVSRLISNLYRRSCEVVHPGTARVHVSGHGSEEDLSDLLALVRPKYLVPIHGEYRMLAQHARLAVRAGFSSDRILLAEDGDVIALSERGAAREARIPAGRILLDRSSGEEVEDVVIRDRRHLSADGIVVPVIVLDRHTGLMESAPEIVTRGFSDSGELMEEAGRLVTETIETRPREEADLGLTRERVKLELRRFFKRRTQKRPMVIPVVMEV